MDTKKEILNILYKFDYLGVETLTDGAVLIDKAPFKGSQAWLNILYPVLDSSELNFLKNELRSDIPFEYQCFLQNFSNGVNVLSSTFSLYGLRKQV